MGPSARDLITQLIFLEHALFERCFQAWAQSRNTPLDCSLIFLLQVVLDIGPTSSKRLDYAGLAVLSFLNFNGKQGWCNARQTVGLMTTSSAFPAVGYLVGINFMLETGFSFDVVSTLVEARLWENGC